VALRTKWHRANARRSDTRTGGSASSWRDHVTEEALLRIINMAPNISLGGRTAPAEDRFAGQLMYETQGQPPDTSKLRSTLGRVGVSRRRRRRDRRISLVGRRLWSCVAPCRPCPVVPGWRRSSTASTVLSNRPDSNARRPGSSCPQLTRRATLRRPGWRCCAERMPKPAATPRSLPDYISQRGQSSILGH
jgi:hypothetical protein